MDTVSMTQARNNFSDLINKVVYGSDRVVISKMGKPVALLMSIKDLNASAAFSKKPPSETAGTITLPKNVTIRKVFEAIKTPYETASLLGR